MNTPEHIRYLTLLLSRARRRLRTCLKDGGDAGAITLEWIVIAALLFAIALAAALAFQNVVRQYMSQLG